MSIWNEEGKLAELEQVREKHRLAGKKLTFDCLNMKVEDGGDTVDCKYGRIPSPSLLHVLRGVCYTPCKECPYWVTEINKGGQEQ